jgi:tRNA (cytidine32/uridine32-2'-O)-methyltransferase
LASNEAVAGFLDHLENVMTQSGFLNPQQPGQVMTRMRRLFMRARPDKMEMSILRGVLVALERKMPRNDGE